jgi:hypothetical protein
MATALSQAMEVGDLEGIELALLLASRYDSTIYIAVHIRRNSHSSVFYNNKSTMMGTKGDSEAVSLQSKSKPKNLHPTEEAINSESVRLNTLIMNR